MRHVAIGDLDGDGDGDLAVGHEPVYPEPVVVLLNDGTGSFEPSGYAIGQVRE